jgi:hypothetical protein
MSRKQKPIKMKAKILWTFLIALIFTSCAMQKFHTSKTMDIYGAGVIQKPVIVDLDVKETKVTGTASDISGLLENIKSLAVNDALKTSNADVLVEPKFEIQTSGGRTTVTVTGWPATYKNFRAIKEEDVKLLDVGVVQKAKVVEPAVQQKQMGRK